MILINSKACKGIIKYSRKYQKCEQKFCYSILLGQQYVQSNFQIQYIIFFFQISVAGNIVNAGHVGHIKQVIRQYLSIQSPSISLKVKANNDISLQLIPVFTKNTLYLYYFTLAGVNPTLDSSIRRIFSSKNNEIH